MRVVGPYASTLSAADVRDIRRLVLQRSDVGHIIHELNVMQPDKVDINAGGDEASGLEAYGSITVIKRDGRWIVDPHSPIIAPAKGTMVTN